MIRALTLAALAACLAYPAAAQVPTTYDVSTIKLHKPGDNSSSWSYDRDTMRLTNMSIETLLSNAYHVRTFLITGLPPWARHDRFDIEAKMLDVDPKVVRSLTREQRNVMLLAFLKDRFGLEVHPETKVQPVFEMTVMPEGDKLKRSTPLPAPTEDNPHPQWSSNYSTGDGTLKGTAITLEQLGYTLSYDVERVIIDKTGLADGHFDVQLTWTPTEELGKPHDNGAAGDPPPDIFTALKDQLGLKLTATKAPVPTLVVDKITQPDAN